VLPGVIDDHVHFREPGLTAKADIESESRAAAAGGVTTYFDMPNTIPQTTTLEALDEKYALAAQKSHVNYAFFFGATNDNVECFEQLYPKRIPGIKLFMGSSTGNMLVDRDEALNRIFSATRLPIMAHCEDTEIINRNMAEAKKSGGDDPSIALHPFIRSEEACFKSTQKAVELAKKHHARLHVAHLSTAEELDLFPAPNITAEATVGHLYFTLLDYARLGAKIKVNPSIKSPVDQFMLREALNDGRIETIGTDHAPHLLSQKQGGCAHAASGMPMIQFSLVTMLELVDEGVLSLERMVQLMCHKPAKLFGVEKRGFLRPGYQADVTIVRPKAPWTVVPELIQSRCGWSPMEGHTYQWRVEQTLCNGHLIYNKGQVSPDIVGQAVKFCHHHGTQL
jgi:dihydroorotase